MLDPDRKITAALRAFTDVLFDAATEFGDAAVTRGFDSPSILVFSDGRGAISVTVGGKVPTNAPAVSKKFEALLHAAEVPTLFTVYFTMLDAISTLRIFSDDDAMVLEEVDHGQSFGMAHYADGLVALRHRLD